MKSFLAGLITLALLITAVCVNTFYIIKKTDGLIRSLERLPLECSEADTTAFSEEWENSKAWIALTVHRENVDEIDYTLELLRLHCRSGNKEGYLSARQKLLCIAERLRETESFSLSRIF